MDNDCEIRKWDARAVQMTGEVMCKSQDGVCIKTLQREELILHFPSGSLAAGDEKCEVCWSWVGPSPPRPLGAGGKQHIVVGRQRAITSLSVHAGCTLLITAGLFVCCVRRPTRRKPHAFGF